MFSNTDITKIKSLVISSDIHNNLLAFELIKGHRMVAELKTALYLLYNRFVLENLPKEKKIALGILYQYINANYTESSGEKITLAPFLEDAQYSFKKELNKQFKEHDNFINWDKRLIIKALFQHVATQYWGKSLAGFVFKYGNDKEQESVIHLLKSKDYLGRVQLDLGGLELKELPLITFSDGTIKVLDISGNCLNNLVDHFRQLPDLESLNIANNLLKNLPNSILELKKLKQLFAQNNLLEADLLIQQLQQLPLLKKLYITISHLPNEQASKLANFAYLVNENKLNVSLQEQQLCLFLFLRDQMARKQLSLKDFFWGANHSLAEIRKQSIKHILEEEGTQYPIKRGTSIALLGKMSQLTNLKFQSIQKHFAQKKINLTSEINSKTSHIVLGEYPDNYDLIETRSFSFLTEQDFLNCLHKIKTK